MASIINVLGTGDTWHANKWQWYGIVRVQIGRSGTRRRADD